MSTILEEYESALSELKALPNADFKESLENLSRAANLHMDRYHSSNPSCCSKECRREALQGFNSAMEKYFIRCAAAAEIHGNTRERNLYIEFAHKLNCD